MTVLFTTMQAVGAVLCVIGAVWALRTRHARRVWRNTQHNASTVAIVLELEEKVRELEERSATTIDAR